MKLKPLIQVLNLQQMRYAPALYLQQFMIDKHKSAVDGASNNNVLLMVEHPPVYTIGIRTQDYPPSEEKKLKDIGADFHRTDRGGLITFHGPGQLVVYPILNLKNFDDLSVRCYVHKLEEVIVDVCNSYGLSGQRSPHTGVWIGDDKVCALGEFLVLILH